MDNNQNDNSKSKWCPNVIFEKGNISIGEFKTLDEAMSFPIPDKWCVNRTVGDNKFEKYMALNVRVLIICDWSKSIQDSRKFVIALVYPDGQTIYFDFNDIQIDANEYETSLDEDVFNAIERVVSAHYKLHNSETNENKQHKTRYNMKKTIRLSESDLHRVIKESVKRCLKETQKDLGNDEWNGHRTKVQEIFDKINDASLCLKNYLQTCDTKWDNMGALGECARHLYQAAHALESLHMALDTHREPTDQYLGYDY